jgi:precorrin-4/cobalt-precorrin-4 C11-methyltransferase
VDREREEERGELKVESQKHPIIFCGAGPGDPELITVKGQKALAEADLVLYAGSLVPEAVLSWAPAGAERVSSADMTLEQIITRMAEAHDAGRRVVRLHTGDPSLYGAIGEQMAALDSRAIAYRVIPGVTAAFAAAAALGIEFTVPEKTQTLILTRMAGRTPVPETEALADLARHHASMAIYLSMAMVDKVAEVLAEAYGPEAPCAIACRVSHPEEKIVRAPAAELAQAAKRHAIDRLAVIVVGPALEDPAALVALRSKLYDKDFTHGFRGA